MTTPTHSRPVRGEIADGARVTVTEPNGYVATTRHKVKNRVGSVLRVFVPLGSKEEFARVEFDARRKGSPTHIETFPVDALSLATKDPRHDP